MRVDSKTIIDTVSRLCQEANVYLRPDAKVAIQKAAGKETDPLSKKMLEHLLENARIAEEKSLPICQDTGMVVVFVELGRGIELDFVKLDGDINKGVVKGYSEGFFRKSIVKSPILRKNTDDNSPAVIHYDFTRGEGLRISVLVKGFGGENKSNLSMLNPTASGDEIVDYIVGVVRQAGPDACPPYVLGIGLGGTMDKAALISKKALLEDINEPSQDPEVAFLEKKIQEKVNDLRIGVMGLGGKCSCLGVNILTYPTHIAGLPVAVNINCHAVRSARAVI